MSLWCGKETKGGLAHKMLNLVSSCFRPHEFGWIQKERNGNGPHRMVAPAIQPKAAHRVQKVEKVLRLFFGIQNRNGLGEKSPENVTCSKSKLGNNDEHMFKKSALQPVNHGARFFFSAAPWICWTCWAAGWARLGLPVVAEAHPQHDLPSMETTTLGEAGWRSWKSLLGVGNPFS